MNILNRFLKLMLPNLTFLFVFPMFFSLSAKHFGSDSSSEEAQVSVLGFCGCYC